jgi:hypothetical protein
MLGDWLQQTIVYTPQAMSNGSMRWWILPLADGVPERLVVGHERTFLTWFYDGAARLTELLLALTAEHDLADRHERTTGDDRHE